MQNTPTRDTPAEIALRRRLHALGLRYRIDVPPLPGLRRRADVVFRSARVAVFVDGCFWHRCPVHGSDPKANSVWWKAKLDRNVERDRETDRALIDAGWLPIRIWEHENSGAAAAVVARAVAERRGVADPRRGC